MSWLGYGGLIPFLAFGVLTSVDRERGMFWHASLRAYGAVIRGVYPNVPNVAVSCVYLSRNIAQSALTYLRNTSVSTDSVIQQNQELGNR